MQTHQTGIVSTLSGGELFFYPKFDPIRDGMALSSQIRRLASRTTAYSCSMRIRTSNGKSQLTPFK